MALRKIIIQLCPLETPRRSVNILKTSMAFRLFCSIRDFGPVKHDRPNFRFSICLDVDGKQDSAVLHYKFTGEKEVDLLSTDVPESFRGKGVAALLSKAAMDFLMEENLKASISCWYIKKYVEENPHSDYKNLIKY
ncbi:hypothetical protein UPYG_G00106440 [Umbra pygmaea]|uniref:Protein NATD1 n=1 Tax=Umbra pygmaea TaxID=75934 RepID=A0ABD0X681_UMBPY